MAPSEPSHPLGDLARFMAVPRLAGLALSADGTRLVTTVSALNPERTKWKPALWEIDPIGVAAPRRLTRGTDGESTPTFLPDGDLLFTSSRPDPAVKPDGDPPASLWVLPGSGGEARFVVSRPDGVSGIAVAAGSGAVAVVAGTHPGSSSEQPDDGRTKARKEAGVSAILHDGYPVRYWDRDLGPTWPHVYVLGPLADEGSPIDVRDLTPDAGLVAGEAADDLDLSPDGTRLLRTVDVGGPGPAERRTRIELVDVESGTASVLVGDDDSSYSGGRFSPDGGTVAFVRETDPTYDETFDVELWTVALASGERRRWLDGFDRWPNEVAWSADGSTLFFTADDDGHCPVFRVDVGSGEVVKLTASGAYTALQVARDGAAVYALRSAWDAPPRPVRLDPGTVDQDPVPLPSPGVIEHRPGSLERIETVAADGVRIPSWLVLPDGASAERPAPLVLWAHGGPVGSWNAWSWRWCPWLLAARGYAVLLPDPAFSTGYGRSFVQRGWGQWGGAPYTDLMSAVEAALERPDVDAGRTAMMGGSYGGYMANWMATHTDRFRAIVTHASLWHLDGFAGATDGAYFWEREFGDPLTRPERYDTYSPHRFADAIVTPMLVIHGDRDYRVPIGEGLRLWYDLQRRGIESKFLYYPDENHWVLTPGNHTIWYETVLAFLDHHVLDHDWVRPGLV